MKAALVGIAAAMVIGVGLAGPANADDSYHPTGQKGDLSSVDYHSELNSEGIAGWLADTGDIATDICGKLYHGASEGQLVDAGTRAGLNQRQARIAVWAAEWHFCPPRG
jgi:hypothetical protein